ncbi:PEPxxWA-CTERM sorting domain-containing protein [Sphingosinicellaceae bacterium]|nr:PEPxxWA-CTERM sorting domain-containing protein [Sphingosinicellaceae bacterium]
MAYASITKTARSHRVARSAALAAVATAACIAGAAPAYAGYHVETVANTGRGYLRGCAAQYNAGSTGAQFINNDGGGSPCDPGAYLSQQNAVVTVSGSTDTTGTLTAAHDSSSVVALPDAAYAYADADLKAGKVHLLATATNYSGANASARLLDTLHFTIAGATASTVTYIPVSFAFDGTLVGGSDPATASGELNYGFYFGSASAYEFGDYGAGYYGVYGNYPVFTYASAPRVGGWVSSSFSSYDPLDTRFTGIYAITGATADIPIDFSLGLRASQVGLDFLNTGSISIGHVEGVSYTSDSGVFLTAPTSVGGVPEPASWALLVAGFGIVGSAARQRRGTGSLRHDLGNAVPFGA